MDDFLLFLQKNLFIYDDKIQEFLHFVSGNKEFLIYCFYSFRVFRGIIDYEIPANFDLTFKTCEQIVSINTKMEDYCEETLEKYRHDNDKDWNRLVETAGPYDDPFGDFGDYYETRDAGVVGPTRLLSILEYEEDSWHEDYDILTNGTPKEITIKLDDFKYSRGFFTINNGVEFVQTYESDYL